MSPSTVQDYDNFRTGDCDGGDDGGSVNNGDIVF